MSSVELIDLASSEQQSQDLTADICIVGAGAAGIFLATQLAQSGFNVIVLEAGAKACVDCEHIGFQPKYDADHYRGASIGRYFGLGGSTSRWGGQLVPHTQHDHEPTSESFDPWQHITRIVAERSHSVLRRLGLRTDPEFETFAARTIPEATRELHVSGLSVQTGLMLPFGRKNFTQLLENKLYGNGGIRVFLNSIVNSWCLKAEHAASRVTTIRAVSPNQRRLIVTSPKFVIAAGAIESARILLEIRSSPGASALPSTAAIGSYLTDHLSVAIADVEKADANKAAALFVPRFQRNWMRSFRILESSVPPFAPRAFAHFIFSDAGQGAILAKQVLGAIQSRRMPQIQVGDMLMGMTGICHLAYHRMVRSALYVSPATPIHLQLDVEQVPRKENYVRLSATRDRYGRQCARINWQISDTDRERIQTTAQRLLEKWPRTSTRLPKLTARVLSDGQMKPHDAYHPVGTCRMGEDSECVADGDLRVHGVTNLWIASTAVLPSAGTANPTFTLLCLIDRMAQQLCESH